MKQGLTGSNNSTAVDIDLSLLPPVLLRKELPSATTTSTDADIEDNGTEYDENEEEYAGMEDDSASFLHRPLTAEAIDTICASPSFELTSGNFVASGTGEFLKEYALQQQSTPVFRSSGILSSLAATHLGDPNLHYGISTPHRCAPSCSSVVRKLQDNIDEARAVYFTFLSAQHLAETLKSLSNGLLAAQGNVAEISAAMAEHLSKAGDTRSSP